MWYVGIGTSVIGRIDGDGRVTEHPLLRDARPHAVVGGRHDDLWFTEWGANRVGRVDADGAIAEIDLPMAGSEPHGLVVAPDGRVWVALEVGRLAVIDPL